MSALSVEEIAQQSHVSTTYLRAAHKIIGTDRELGDRVLGGATTIPAALRELSGRGFEVPLPYRTDSESKHLQALLELRRVMMKLRDEHGYDGEKIEDTVCQLWMGRAKKKANQAERLLSHALADGPRPANTILKTAQECRLSPRTLNRAKAKLKVKAVKQGNAWFWALPKEDCQV